MDVNSKNKFVSITKKLLFAVVTTSSLVTTVLTVGQIYFEYQTQNSELLGAITALEGSVIPAVGEKLWNLDIQGLKLQMEPVLPSVSASYIKIMNEKAELVYENKKHDFSPKYPILKTYKIHNPLKGNANEFVGTMEIEYFKDYVIEGVEERSLIILLSNVIKTAIVASVLLIIFNRKIAKPILEISSYFNNNRDLNNVSPEGFAPSNRSGASDELSLMIDQISLREKKIFEWSQINKNKIEIAEQALNDADEMIQHEKLRAESSAR